MEEKSWQEIILNLNKKEKPEKASQSKTNEQDNPD